MIKSFADKDTTRVFAREYVRRLAPALHPVAWRKQDGDTYDVEIADYH
jgi:plasmid maintenance system killer protein